MANSAWLVAVVADAYGALAIEDLLVQPAHNVIRNTLKLRQDIYALAVIAHPGALHSVWEGAILILTQSTHILPAEITNHLV
eukprot:337057-Prymnesium_polylepis.1